MGDGVLVASVIIPTYNRLDVLKECLTALYAQEGAPDSWEIIVVDDGSNDGTWDLLQQEAQSAPVPLRVLKNRGKGPASARNVAIEEAHGEILVIAGDDILMQPNWLALHVAAHADDEPGLAILGHTDWDPRIEPTYLMEYLDRGLQFGYGRITDPNDVGYQFFYTSNISLRRSFLRETGELFDESYPAAALEDVDLGYRLTKKGLGIRYLKEAHAYHYHPVEWRDFLRRAYLVGKSCAVFDEKFPELRGKRSYAKPRYGVLKRWTCRAVRPVGEKLSKTKLLDRCYRVAFDCERSRGYRAMQRDGK